VWDEIAAVLPGRLVTLEPLTRDNLDGLRAAAADERIWRFMVTTDVERWLGDALAEHEAGRRVQCVALREGEAVGSTSYLGLAPEHLRLEIGNTWMSPATWGTGANVEAKYLLLRHAFETLGCRRVEFKTDSLNEPSRTALLGIGATFEGVFRNHMVMPDGRMRHSAYYSVIDDEWPAVKGLLERSIAR